MTISQFRELGFATFELNSFKSRGITSTVGSQDEVTIAAIVLDAFRAMDELAKHPSIDPEQISIGRLEFRWRSCFIYSMGTPCRCAGKNQSIFFTPGFLPPCFIESESLNFVNAPIKTDRRNR